ncbi:unnamed protein product [Boreogadus saida]
MKLRPKWRFLKTPVMCVVVSTGRNGILGSEASHSAVMARFHCRVRNGSDRKGAGRLHPVPREVGVLGVLQHPLSEALSYHRKRSFLKTPAKVEISENAGYVCCRVNGEKRDFRF